MDEKGFWRARGMLRRTFWISSAISEADSLPIKEKITIDQKNDSWSDTRGVHAVRVNGVAEPNSRHATKPRTTMIRTGIHMATAPKLCAHLARFSPRIFRTVRPIRIETENEMK